jgi:FtsZ-interacting cell division protein ZipA
MLALWVLLTFAILLFAIVFLLWRLRNCKCSLYETFESSTDAEKETDAEADAKADAKAETKDTEAEVEVKEPSKEVVEKDAEDTEDSETAVAAEKATTEIKKKNTGSSVADKFMNYSEMKIFDSLRDNAYSLQDIKRMIREGEINEKMIEKFLARVEKMEDRVQSKPESKTTIEGFTGNNYANAYFN